MAVGAAAKLPPVTVTELAVKLATPPQVVDAGPVTVTPAGMASVNVKPLIAVAFKLVSVMVNVLDPPAMMPAGLNTLVTNAAFCTRTVVEMAAVFLAVCALVTLLAAIVFVALASVGVVLGNRATTSAWMAQLLFVAIVPPDNMMLVPPPAAVRVPPQVLEIFGTAASSSWVGKLSVNPTLVNAKPLVLFNWIRKRVEVPLPWMFVGVKVLVPVMGLTPLTDNVALAGDDDAPMELDTFAVGMVLT